MMLFAEAANNTTAISEAVIAVIAIIGVADSIALRASRWLRARWDRQEEAKNDKKKLNDTADQTGRVVTAVNEVKEELRGFNAKFSEHLTADTNQFSEIKTALKTGNERMGTIESDVKKILNGNGHK